jgi:hypothetical protein
MSIMMRLNFDQVGLNFDQAIANSAMIHVMVLSARVRRNEKVWQTRDIDNMFGSTFGSKNSQ